MESNSEVNLLRIFMSSTDKYKHTPLFEVIVYEAKRYGIAGATVLKGAMGYGASSKVTNTRFWELTEKIPIVIEMVDESEKIMKFFETIKPVLEKSGKGCIATMEKASVIYYKTGITPQ